MNTMMLLEELALKLKIWSLIGLNDVSFYPKHKLHLVTSGSRNSAS